MHREKAWAKNKAWLWLFLVLSVVSAVFTWKSVFSVLPAFASVLLIFSLWKNKPMIICTLAFPISTAMLIYNIYCDSYLGIANEILTLFSAFVGVVKNKKTAKKKF